MRQITNHDTIQTGHFIYYLLRPVARLLMRLVCRLSVRGLDHVPATGSLLLVSNHLSWIDPLLVASLIHRRTWFFAKREIFSWPIVGWLVRRTGQIPVHRGESDRTALEQSLAYLHERRALLVFPEGTVARKEQMLAAHTGVAMLALRGGAMLLPIALTGSRRILRPGGGWRPHVSVQIGEPFVPSLPPGVSRKEALRSITHDVMLRIAAMQPPQQRGVYVDQLPE
ncbi:MAG: 1-acyl-sn-glycerol-3-phosphate acyltransferase [Ktedonobacteraceae bacterium]|nr:1-acyl-sn-glycerol-3-phosphate acyltransferase [Ktedonobacteraceae bacterium]MBO0790244.1 1-acyl-sn-glycerol-3-phosphate acyltransferase [Ktedonobacteraceae bacterium]